MVSFAADGSNMELLSQIPEFFLHVIISEKF